MTVAILKKISMKVLAGNIKTLVKDAPENETLWLARVMGVGKGIKTGESNYGPWTAILGDFQVQVFAGEKADQTFRSGQIFLPEVAENMVAPAVANLAKGETVLFAFDIGVMPDAESSTGYVYVAAFVKEPEENDPLSIMAKEMKSLPAPGAAKETTKK